MFYKFYMFKEMYQEEFHPYAEIKASSESIYPTNLTMAPEVVLRVGDFIEFLLFQDVVTTLNFIKTFKLSRLKRRLAGFLSEFNLRRWVREVWDYLVLISKNPEEGFKNLTIRFSRLKILVNLFYQIVHMINRITRKINIPTSYIS